MTEFAERWDLDFKKPGAMQRNMAKALDVSQALEQLFTCPADGITLQWGPHEVKIPYAYGVSDILGDVLDMLEALDSEGKGEYYFGFTTNEPDALDTDWHLVWDEDHLDVQADWRDVHGGMDPSLKGCPMLRVSRQRFRESWCDLLVFLMESVQGIPLDHDDEMRRIIKIISRIKESERNGV